MDSKKETSVYEEIRTTMESQTLLLEEEKQVDTSKEEIQLIEYEPPEELVLLMNQYSDCIGYLDIEGTEVHYPLMQSTENDYYLHRDMNGKESVYGCIYLDSNHSFQTSGLHTIYGHNMKDGQMFHDIGRFLDKHYLETHTSVIIRSKESSLSLRPVYCYAGKADGSYRLPIYGKKNISEFTKQKTGNDYNTEDLYVFVTCNYSVPDGRTYLYCVPQNSNPS